MNRHLDLVADSKALLATPPMDFSSLRDDHPATSEGPLVNLVSFAVRVPYKGAFETHGKIQNLVMHGSQHFRLGWMLTFAAWVAGIAIRAGLYFRPTPYGGPFVAHWDRYFFHSLFYNLFGVFILFAPFALYWLWRRNKVISDRAARWIHGLLVLLLSLSILGDQFDAEVMRSMGVHATPSFLATYWKIGGSMDMMIRSMNHDVGGPWSALIIPAVVLIGFWVCSYRYNAPRLAQKNVVPWGLKTSFLAAALPVVIVLVAVYTPGGKFRYRKVRPYLMTLAVELQQDQAVGKRPPGLDKLAAEYQEVWMRESADKSWTFKDAERPYIRTPHKTSKPTDAGRWNVILLQVETLRGLETGALRPSLKPSPTPNLDRLANPTQGALWTRFLTFGPPTVTGTLSGHCGVRPHSRHNVTTRYTYAEFLCLPQVLRKLGYRAEYFTASDPDWDGQAYWLSKWYDQHVFYRDAKEADTIVLERVTKRILELGASGQPFMATIATISNHYPFNSRDSRTDIAGTEHIQDRIKNTTHYTDAAIGKMIRRLEKEAFFKKTLIVVFGDHGYNLGEHRPAGQRNGFHESTWSPLIIYGDHPRLPKGHHRELANLMDIAPTIADVLGIRIRNPWSGHSLLKKAPQRILAHTKDGITFAESPTHSVVWDRETGQPEAFKSDDLMQKKPVEVPTKLAQELIERAKNRALLNDYLIETAKVWKNAQ